MASQDREAGEFLTAELIAANFCEFHQRLGKLLRKYLEGRLTAPEAMEEARRVHELVTRYNNNLSLITRLPPA